MSKARALGWILLAVAALWTVAKAAPPGLPEDGMDIHAFGRIPVQYDGREKPLDTVARGWLTILSEKESFVDGAGKRQPAVRWLLDVMSDFHRPTSLAGEHRVFRIVNSDLQGKLGLDPKRPRYRYALVEFGDKVQLLLKEWNEIGKRVKAQGPADAYEQQLKNLLDRVQIYVSVSQLEIPSIVPPEGDGKHWLSLSEVMQESAADSPLRDRARQWREMLAAYARNDSAAFNAAVGDYVKGLAASRSGAVRKASFESFFNRVDPFQIASLLYLTAFLLAATSWLVWSGPLNRSASLLIAASLVLHTLALVGRIYLSGRPPVTNLYSSAVFVGWGAVALGMVLERVFRMGVGNAVAGAAGFLTLLLAPFLAADGSDTMAVLQAVLDTQFWLATHVVCITLGYSTTYVAGFLGIILVIRGVLTPTLTPDLQRALARMIYGVTCFAMFFSFVGTVLGGLWADDSWGRFWGWDPKENGALMIVLWNALTLHARWGGLVRERGLALLAIVGNIIVTWSWFGTNLLGVGLHAYGFDKRLFWVVTGVVGANAVVLALGLKSRETWRSPMPAQGAGAKGAEGAEEA